MNQNLNSEIRQILDKLQLVKHSCRKDFIGLYIPSLIRCGSVQFHQAAKYLNDEVKVKSNTTRIQDFYREVEIDYNVVALLLLVLMPKNGKLRICIDRTEWDFGSYQANILMILVGQGDFHIPFYWELLDNKSGNSNSDNRIELLQKVVEIIGIDRIGMVVGDREFIGHKWLKWLKDNQIAFCVRVPKSHLITRLHGEILQSETLAKENPAGIFLEDCMVDGIWGGVFIKPIEEILYIFGTVKTHLLGKLYKKRWTIEACFENLKTRGFNLEDSHMKISDKLSKLVAMVSISYAFCVSLGIYAHRKIKKIKVKNHGYKKNSFFRVGMDMIFENFRDKSTIQTVIAPIFKVFARFIRIILK
jgi:hypothetical protein